MKSRVLHKLISVLLLFCVTRITAQQDPMYSMYMFDKALINPAFAGSADWVVGTIKYRDQNNAINGHPNTQTFNVHAPWQKKHIGAGLRLVQDRIAVLSTLNAALQLSYHLNLAGGKLSLGIEGGILSKRINYQKLILASRGDNVIPGNTLTEIGPDAAAGLYYQKKQFYLGLSSHHLLSGVSQNSGSIHTAQHWYLLLGNVFDLSRRWSLEPSALIKYRDAETLQADVNLMVYYDELIGLGMQYRTGDAVIAMLRVNITEGFRIAYAYDRTISAMAPFSGATHEIVLSYGIRLLPPARQKEIHPRYYF